MKNLMAVGLLICTLLGYGQSDSSLKIHLIFNPQGAELPPQQSALEIDYKKHLMDNYNIAFDFQEKYIDKVLDYTSLSRHRQPSYDNKMKNVFQVCILNWILNKKHLP